MCSTESTTLSGYDIEWSGDSIINVYYNQGENDLVLSYSGNRVVTQLSIDEVEELESILNPTYLKPFGQEPSLNPGSTPVVVIRERKGSAHSGEVYVVHPDLGEKAQEFISILKDLLEKYQP